MPIGDLLAQITGEPSPTATTHTIPPLPKRKPDEQLRRPVDKIQRTETPVGGPSRPTTQSNKPSAVDSSTAKMKLGQSGRPSLQSPTATFKNGQPTPPPQNEPAKAPKKGSFAEIMARGKAAQSTLGQVGKIQHKKIEKLPSKREREEMKATKAQNLQKNLGPNGKFRSAGQNLIRDGRNVAKDGERRVSNGKVGNGKVAPGKKSAEAEAERKVKKAALATTGYTGTARPRPGAKASSRPSASGSSRYDRGDRYRDDRYRSSSKRQSYLSEDEEDEEEEEDYGSDVSSDMEAAAFEVDEEEELATRIARQEDAEALAEENRHKREKEEKRRRLAAMAKSRR